MIWNIPRKPIDVARQRLHTRLKERNAWNIIVPTIS